MSDVEQRDRDVAERLTPAVGHMLTHKTHARTVERISHALAAIRAEASESLRYDVVHNSLMCHCANCEAWRTEVDLRAAMTKAAIAERDAAQVQLRHLEKFHAQCHVQRDEWRDRAINAENEVPAIRAQVAALREALRLIEWSYLIDQPDDEGPYELCPRCVISRAVGHGTDCEIGRVLADTAAATQHDERIRADERERCAKLADTEYDMLLRARNAPYCDASEGTTKDVQARTACTIAAAIRALKP